LFWGSALQAVEHRLDFGGRVRRLPGLLVRLEQAGVDLRHASPRGTPRAIEFRHPILGQCIAAAEVERLGRIRENMRDAAVVAIDRELPAVSRLRAGADAHAEHDQDETRYKFHVRCPS
jgi:hypothetical protein